MLLKSLEITGFKSFARKGNLSFETPITSIVGPNGSGKSNVAESFRFVLGEQSIKSMRGKKGEDLIFNGTPQVGRLNRASVKLTFDNASKFLPIDFDEVTIERSVHRDGMNEYFLNGSACRLKDIVDLLSNANIGASGHHIISQGEADRILNANARERREMIEDALGLKVFQNKKEESKRKLDRTFENVEKVESLRREIAPHIRYLKKQVEKVEKAKELRESLRAAYREYLVREYRYINAEKKRIAEALITPRQELQALEEQLVVARSEIAAAQGATDESRKIDELEEKLRTIRTRKAQLSHEIGMAEGELRSLARIQEEARRKAEQEDLRTVPLREVRSLTERFSSQSIFSSPDESDVQGLKKWTGELIDSLQGLVKRFEGEAPIAVVSYDFEIKELNNRQNGAKDELAIQEQYEHEARQALEAVRASVEAAKEGTRDAEKRILSIMARQNELHATVQGLVREEERRVFEESEFKREMTEAAVLAGRDVIDFLDAAQETDATVSDTIANGPEERSVQLERRRQLEKLKIRLEETGVGQSDDILREFAEVNERDAFLVREITDLQASADALKKLVAELDEQITVRFQEGIGKINAAFGQFFSSMFGGGNASLIAVKEKKRVRKDELSAALSELGGVSHGDQMNEEQEGEEGIDISVDLPRKKIKSLIMLSGGERALTSIALLFAMSQVNPPPFIILDETDAALDEANSRKYGDMIEALSKYSQLILITHNRETMSRAGVIYGVTMGADGVSKLLSIKFDEAVKVAK